MKIYVDMDGVLCDYDKAFNVHYDKELNEFPQKHPGFFKNLDPITGAIEGINALVGAGYDVFILTRPSVKNNHCWSEKAAWIEEHLGFRWLERTIITCRKDLLADGDSWLIDDVISSAAGQQAFRNKLIWFNPLCDWKKISFIMGAD